jgi:hypothetical protein
MNNNKLCNTDITNKCIYLEKNVHSLFERYIGKKVRIVDNDGCEFFFDVKKSHLSQNPQKKKRGQKKTKEDEDKDFFDLLALDEGDEILFNRDDEHDCFVVNIKEKTSSNSASIDEDDRIKLINAIYKVYMSVGKKYRKIFDKNRYLPTKVSSNSINGFTERNLTFNFCHSYLSRHHNAIVWQEIPINSPNAQHIDSIIIDNKNDWVIYIEAKRLYDVHHFKYLLDDLKRIKKQHLNIPLPPKHPSKKVIVLLADHVCDVKKDEKVFYDKYFTGQKGIDLPQIDEKKYPNLAKKLPSMINSDKISAICDKTQTITICGEYNISIEKEIKYTIYCGVFFLE